MQEYCYNCMRPLEGAAFCKYCGADSKVKPQGKPYFLPCGTVLSNRYIIGRVIGEGGFGITYIGMDTTLSKRVAVKEFYPSGIASRNSAVSKEISVLNERQGFFRGGVERFMVEAKSVAAFSDEEGIVDVQDVVTSCLERKIPDKVRDIAHRSFAADPVETLERKGSRIFASHGCITFFLCLLQKFLLQILGSTVEPNLHVLFDK